MNATDIIRKINTLKQKAHFYWPDHVFLWWCNSITSDKIGTLVVVNFDNKYGDIHEYLIHISSNGDFTVERPLYSDNGYLIHTPQMPGPYKTDWERLMNNWIPTVCPELMQEKRVSIIKQELLSKVLRANLPDR